MAYSAEESFASFCILRPYSSSSTARFLKNTAASYETHELYWYESEGTPRHEPGRRRDFALFDPKAVEQHTDEFLWHQHTFVSEMDNFAYIHVA